MSRHEKFAICLGFAVWLFLALFPPAVVWGFPAADGLKREDAAFYGIVVGAVLFLQAAFSAQASERYSLSNFAFLMSCTTMGAFIALAGPSILPADHDKVVSTGVAELSYAGLLVSVGFSYIAARVMEHGREPGAASRLLLFVVSGAIFAYYILVVLYSRQT